MDKERQREGYHRQRSEHVAASKTLFYLPVSFVRRIPRVPHP